MSKSYYESIYARKCILLYIYSNLTIYRRVKLAPEGLGTQDFLDFLPFFCSLPPESYISPTPPSNGKL